MGLADPQEPVKLFDTAKTRVNLLSTSAVGVGFRLVDDGAKAHLTVVASMFLGH